MISESRTRKAVRTVVLAVITFLFIFPVLWTLSLSIKPSLVLFELPPVWVFDPIWEAYRRIFVEGEAWRAVINSLIIAGGSTLLTILIGTPAAYSLGRLRVRGRRDIMLFIIASRMAPPVALVVPFFLVYKFVGLLDSHLGLVIVYLTFNLSFYIWLVSIMSRELPEDLEGAGQTDGYGPWSVFLRVVIPLMKPSIIAVGVLVFIFAWNEFAYALILGGVDTRTLPIAASETLTPSGVQWGELAALGTVSLAPVAFLVFFLHKQIIRGLAMGAVRG